MITHLNGIFLKRLLLKVMKMFLKTKFQLSKFYRPESTDIKGFSKSGTIEWE